MIKQFFFFLLLTPPLCATEQKEEIPPEEIEERCVETTHKVVIEGEELTYQACAGNLLLRDEKKKPEASLFFVSYTKEGADPTIRPITFCFNGGPGSSSVWLNMGGLGPVKVIMDDLGYAAPPFRYEANPYSILDQTDLVFVDPVSTGFSHSVNRDEEKKYHNADEDIKTMARFIRQYTTKHGRWDSPKFLAGESYGTLRAAGLANALHDKDHLYINGILLISSVLNYQSISIDSGNDLPYLLFLPSYTAAAWYHGRLGDDLQVDFSKAIHEA